MYPLIFSPFVKSALWGGERLAAEFGMENGAVAFLLSESKSGFTSVKNGSQKGKSLTEVYSEYKKDFFGEKFGADAQFPLKIKLIDAKDRLPICVSTRPRTVYIADAENDAQMICGFNADTTREEIEKRVNTNLLSSACLCANVKKGDMITIPAGTIHAIGRGILAFEIDCADEVCYAVTDYGRVDQNGKTLPVNPKKALEIMNFSKAPQFFSKIEDTMLFPFGTVADFGENDRYICSVVKLSGNMGIAEHDSFCSLIGVEGNLTLSYASGDMNITKGTSLLIPAGMNVKITGIGTFLCTRLK